ncbi:MAG: glycosyltransferase family 4 protein [candidate division KSB1 bacterium]|nr:glycosyltransferase family 4 protein [candidate division KSB1 bacterium]
MTLRLLFIGDPAAIHVQRWVRYFAQTGHEVHLVPYPDSFSAVAQGTFEGVHIHKGEFRRRMKNWRGFYSKYLIVENIFRVRRLLSQNEFDLLHAHYISACGWTGAWTGFHPFVLTAWGSDVNVDPYRSPFYQYLTRLAIRRADLITANSNDLKKKLIALGADQNKIRVIQGGLELEKFPFQRGNDLLRRQLGLREEKVVLSTRMLGQVYNLDIVVKSIPLVRAEVPEIKFIFIYRGTQEQEKELRKLVQELGVSDVALLMGPVDNNRIAEYYHLADIFVSVASSEGMPGSLTEAMACGAVPIVSDLPFVKEWIRPNINGLVVPVRNANTLAQAIVTLLRDPQKRMTMAQRNRELVVKQADHRMWMKQVEQIYRELSHWRGKAVIGN